MGNHSWTVMKIVSFIFLFAIAICSNGQTKNPFLTIKFDKVKMYDIEGGDGSDTSIVDDKGELATSISKIVTLRKQTITKLNIKLGDKKSYGGATDSCFDPHLGFVFYLKGNIVEHISISLDCNRLRSSIDIPAQKQGKVGNGKDAYYISDGLSKSFRQFINMLLKRNQFSHQIKPGSSFDK